MSLSIAFNLAKAQHLIDKRLQQLRADKTLTRLWQKDASLWGVDLKSNLGWLTLPQSIAKQVPALEKFVTEARADGFDHAVIVGMGGSVLAARVWVETFSVSKNGLRVTVFDTTHPRAIAQFVERLNLKKTLFVVASKSGTTLETVSLFHYFYQCISEISSTPNKHFVVISDPGTALSKEAEKLGLRHTFNAPADVGGRYSALSIFGLLPAVLLGLDGKAIASEAERAAKQCEEPDDNSGLKLAALMAEMSLIGRDRMLLLPSKKLSSVPIWIEQLVAESSGKAGHGILPICMDSEMTTLTPVARYNHHFIVAMKIANEPDQAIDHDLGHGLGSNLEIAKSVGIPVAEMILDDVLEIAGAFFIWELATAICGAILKINPFDQPQVELTKSKTKALLQDPPAKLNPSSSGWIELLKVAEDHDYIALLSFLQPTATIQFELRSMVAKLRSRGHSVTLGLGPEYLHSTGQLHKGDSNRGLFIIFCEDLSALPPAQRLPIPEQSYDFAALITAQAFGDYQALRELDRRAVLVPLKGSIDLELKSLVKKL